MLFPPIPTNSSEETLSEREKNLFFSKKVGNRGKHKKNLFTNKKKWGKERVGARGIGKRRLWQKSAT